MVRRIGFAQRDMRDTVVATDTTGVVGEIRLCYLLIQACCSGLSGAVGSMPSAIGSAKLGRSCDGVSPITPP